MISGRDARFFFYFPELMVNLFLLIDRFACQIDAQLLEDLRIHVGEQDGSVNFAALQLWKLL